MLLNPVTAGLYPGHPRLPTLKRSKKDVDARDKRGHAPRMIQYDRKAALTK
jgi:hypothetical protein